MHRMFELYFFGHVPQSQREAKKHQLQSGNCYKSYANTYPKSLKTFQAIWIMESHLRYMVFAGSGIVHMCGGVGGLMGTYIMGPRKGRFEEGVDQSQFEAHNVPESARTQMIENQRARPMLCPILLMGLRFAILGCHLTKFVHCTVNCRSTRICESFVLEPRIWAERGRNSEWRGV